MHKHEDDETDASFGHNSEKPEYSQTLETHQRSNVDKKKSIFEAKIISYENCTAPNSPILASSSDDVHIIFKMPKEYFRELDSNSLKYVLAELRNRSLMFSTDSVVDKRSGLSQQDTGDSDRFKEMKNFEKIINTLDSDNFSDIIASFKEDVKDLKYRDKLLSEKLGEKVSNSESKKSTNCKVYMQDKANDFISAEKNYQTTLKNITKSEISFVHENSETDYSVMHHQKIETEKFFRVNNTTQRKIRSPENSKCYKTERKDNGIFDKGIFNPESSDNSFAHSQLKYSLYQQEESDDFYFKRQKESLPLDKSCSAKEISELSDEKKVQITGSSEKKPILNDYVRHVDEMLNSRDIQFSSSYFGYDDHSNTNSTSTIFLISSGEPTFYSMKSAGSQVTHFRRSSKKFDEDLESELLKQATEKCSLQDFVSDSEKRPKMPLLRNGDSSLIELAAEVKNEFSKNSTEDTLKKQNIYNRKTKLNEDILPNLKIFDHKQAKAETSSELVFNEYEDNDAKKSTNPEINKNSFNKDIVQKNDEKVSFYILTALEEEKRNIPSECSGALAKTIVQENTNHRKTSSDFVRSTCMKTDEPKKCNNFTKITDIDFVDEVDKKSDANVLTLQKNIESENNSDSEEQKSDTNGILKNEGDEIDCAPTRVRQLETHIPFIEWDNSESPFSRHEKFSNSFVVSGSNPANRIPHLRRSFRSRSLESISSMSFPLTKINDKLASASMETDSAEKKKKRLSFSGIMSKKDIKSAVVNSTWEITKALIVSPESSPISKKRANSEVVQSSQALSRSKLRASMDFVKKHTKRGSKVKK